MQSNFYKIRNIEIVVNSCDAYSDIWEMFFLCFKEYWPDNQATIHLNTETTKFSLPEHLNINVKMHSYKSGPVDQWGARLISTLESIESEFIVMLYDDFLLNKKVDHKKFAELVNLIVSSEIIDVIYLTKLVGVKKSPWQDSSLSLVGSDSDYRLNSAPAIWRKSALLNYTREQDNPWAWEFFGSYRTFKHKKQFIAISDTHDDVYPYDYQKGGAIYRGKWVVDVVTPVIEKYKLAINLNRRGILESYDFPKRDLKWKILFLAIGVKMLGIQIVLVVYRVLKTKISKFKFDLISSKLG